MDPVENLGPVVATYVRDTSKWADWQNDYRLGLILIMPPREVSDLIDPLRREVRPEISFQLQDPRFGIGSAAPGDDPLSR